MRGGADLLDAVSRLTAAANEGSTDAAYVLAVMTADGIGVAQDLTASLTHLQRARVAGRTVAEEVEVRANEESRIDLTLR